MPSKPRSEVPIVIVYVYPPVPCRSYDWCAYREGTEEQQQYGWGRTPDEATIDLLALELEASQ